MKEWFAAITSDELSKLARQLGGDRRATVKSDIALNIPGLSTPIFFHAETEGTIAETRPQFDQSVAYPWLTPNSFNGWFIPDGQRDPPQRLGEMAIEQSLAFDFRAKNLEQLIRRYIELNAAANLPAPSLGVRHRVSETTGQLTLDLPTRRKVLLVVGHKCAGKTTFGDIANQRDDIQVLEASRLFQSAARDRSFTGATDADALAFLQRVGLETVAVEAAKIIGDFQDQFCIVTGLRTVEEVLFLKHQFGDVHVVLVDSDERLRFERLVQRGRELHISDFGAFKSNDELQSRFGLLRVGREIADTIIMNDGPMETYIRRVNDFLNDFRLAKPTERPSRAKNSELYRSLAALKRLAQPSTCEEISDETARWGHRVRKYNTNRALKQLPEFAERMELRGAKVRYRLSPRGAKLIDLIDAA